MLGMGETRIGPSDAGLLFCALPVDPVAEIGVDQFFERPPALAVGCGEPVVIDQRMEAVSPPVPDVPDEGALMEQLTVLLEESVTQPIVRRLAGISHVSEKARNRFRLFLHAGACFRHQEVRASGGRFRLPGALRSFNGSAGPTASTMSR